VTYLPGFYRDYSFISV